MFVVYPWSVEVCLCLARGGVGGEAKIWALQSRGNRGSVGRVSVFELRCCRGEWAREGVSGVMHVCVVSLDYLCIWQDQGSVYRAWRIPTHLRCTQCSILFHNIDIDFLTYICLWQISQI